MKLLTDDGRTQDVRRLTEPAYTISSPEPSAQVSQKADFYPQHLMRFIIHVLIVLVKDRGWYCDHLYLLGRGALCAYMLNRL